MPSDKSTKGRQKIYMKLIDNDSARRITFTKRRNGVYKKATELSALCGAEIAIILLCGAGRKAYSFGHPSVESVVKKFENGNGDNDGIVEGEMSSTDGSANGDGCEGLQKLTEQCDKMHKEIEKEKQRGKELDAALGKMAPPGRICGEYLNRLDLAELVRLKEALEKLREGVRRECNSAMALDTPKVEEEEKWGADGAPEPIPGDWLKL